MAHAMGHEENVTGHTIHGTWQPTSACSRFQSSYWTRGEASRHGRSPCVCSSTCSTLCASCAVNMASDRTDSPKPSSASAALCAFWGVLRFPQGEASSAFGGEGSTPGKHQCSSSSWAALRSRHGCPSIRGRDSCSWAMELCTGWALACDRSRRWAPLSWRCQNVLASSVLKGRA